MSLSAYTNTLEARVLSSDPVQLIDILYRLAIDAVEAARNAHAEGDILTRGRHILKAFDVLVELQNSLDFEKGGEVARNYARIYDYCQRRVLAGHTTASDACFVEVISLLGDMKDAWQAVLKQCSPAELDKQASMIPPDSLSEGSRMLAGDCFA
jgi:flagellar secretion chaperone FliS